MMDAVKSTLVGMILHSGRSLMSDSMLTTCCGWDLSVI